jgi:hypothetical protein
MGQGHPGGEHQSRVRLPGLGRGHCIAPCFLGDEFAEIGGRAHNHRAAQVGEARLHPTAGPIAKYGDAWKCLSKAWLFWLRGRMCIPERSEAAQRKARNRCTDDGLPVHSFCPLLADLAL